MAVPGVSLLNRVVVRVWESAQDAPSQLDFDLHSITLRFLSQFAQWQRSARYRPRTVGYQKVTEAPTLDSAAIEVFGCLFSEFGYRSDKRDHAREAELWNCIPDYDPTAGKSPGREGRMYDTP